MKFPRFGTKGEGVVSSGSEQLERRYHSAERAADLFLQEELKPLVDAFRRYAEDGDLGRLKSAAGEALDALRLEVDDAIGIYAAMIDDGSTNKAKK